MLNQMVAVAQLKCQIVSLAQKSRQFSISRPPLDDLTLVGRALAAFPAQLPAGLKLNHLMTQQDSAELTDRTDLACRSLACVTGSPQLGEKLATFRDDDDLND